MAMIRITNAVSAGKAKRPLLRPETLIASESMDVKMGRIENREGHTGSTGSSTG